ncbi:MAG: AAC(3) family N-acetyltransferase [Candidatus Heimdallarchaeota archaeon]|nr:AAC(3) family N-acetyltransferase [Candidatus Heimdallarchaeota archaeon]
MESWKREEQVVKNTVSPITMKSLIRDFQNIGLKKGDIVIVHSSMSKIGWIAGGPETIVDALMAVITTKGTIVMPTMSTGNTDPQCWNYPPVPQEWWEIIRKESTPYRPDITPTRGMGRIPEIFRQYKGVLRSNHPVASFAAWGKYAKKITKEHNLIVEFGKNSPLGKLYDMNAKILLIGVGHENNTSLHLAECLADLPNHPSSSQGAAILENGKRVWLTWTSKVSESDDFHELGLAFEKSINYKPGKIGQAESRLFNMRENVDFGIQWLKTNRRYSEKT